MPGRESLMKHQYYGNNRNVFWKIIFAVFNYQPTDDYEQRKTFLLNNHIALWDTIKSCERLGSLDSDIKNPTINDFESLLVEYPNIKNIFFNGKTSQKLFERTVKDTLSNKDLSFHALPSTSPANNTIPFEPKLEQWKEIKQVE